MYFSLLAPIIGPSGLSVMKKSWNSITIVWSTYDPYHSHYLHSYEVKVGNRSFAMISKNETSFKITGLRENVEYLIRLRSTSNGGPSHWTDIIATTYSK